MITLPQKGTFSAFAMIVDINGFAKLALSDFQDIAEFTSEVLIGGVYSVEKNGGQVVGFMGDAFFAILHEPENVFRCCSEIAKDMASQYEYFSSSNELNPLSPDKIGLKIGVEYGKLDTAWIYSKFLGVQQVFTGKAVTYASRILTAGAGNRCIIGPNAYEQGLKQWIQGGSLNVKGKKGEGEYKFYVLELGDVWTN
jgi:class 3 adenylate cyclase